MALVPTASQAAKPADASVPATTDGQVSVPPELLVDTRVGYGLSGPVPGHSTSTFAVTDAEISAATELRVTVVDPSTSGYLSVYATPSPRPDSSSINFAAGRNTSNTVFVGNTGATGEIAVYNGSDDPVQFAIDETGVVDGENPRILAGLLEGVGSYRVLDTRSGLGAPVGPVRPHHALSFPVESLPQPSDQPPVSAVVMNLTVVHPSASGYAVAYPGGTARPATSTVNFGAGDTAGNLTVLPVGTSGQVTVYNGSGGDMDLTADVEGFYYGAVGTPTVYGALQPIPAARVVDTRDDINGTAVPAHGTEQVKLAGKGGLSTTGTGSVLANVTAVDPVGGGHLAVYPVGQTRPDSASVSFTTGVTTAIMSIVPVSASGAVDVYNDSDHSVDFLIDTTGYYLNPQIRRPNPMTWSQTAIQFPPINGTPFNANQVSCPTATFCAAISDGDIRTFSGDTQLHSYRLTPATGNASTGQISCATATFCLAQPAPGVYFTFTGSTWTPDPSAISYTDVTCVGPSSCIGLNGPTAAATFTGRNWTAIADPPVLGTAIALRDDFHALSCASAEFCMYVNNNGSATIWNGTAWSTPVQADPIGIYDKSGTGPSGVSCPTTTFCMIIDRVGNAITYRAGTFSIPYNLGATELDNLSNVSCSSATFCAATDNTGALTYNGSTWSAVSPLPVFVDAIECPTSTYCVTGTEQPGDGLYIGT